MNLTTGTHVHVLKSTQTTQTFTPLTQLSMSVSFHTAEKAQPLLLRTNYSHSTVLLEGKKL